MKKHFVILSLLLVSSAIFFGCGEKRADGEAKAVEQVVEQYIASINTCDTTIVSRIWSHSRPVSFIAPSGYYPSYEAIRDSLVLGLFGSRFSRRHLQKEELQISVDGNMAWSQFFWTFDATTTGGTVHQTRGRETQIFIREGDGSWRLVHIHYSGR